MTVGEAWAWGTNLSGLFLQASLEVNVCLMHLHQLGLGVVQTFLQRFHLNTARYSTHTLKGWGLQL